MSNAQIKNAVDFFDAIWNVTVPSITSSGNTFPSTVSTGNTFPSVASTSWVSGEDWEKYVFSIPTNVKIYDDSFPPMNVWVENDSKDLVLEFAVAGIPKENLHIDFEDGNLILEIDARDDEREGYTLSQRGIRSRKSKTYYSIPFSKYNIDEAKAALENGILAIMIPARDEIKPKRLLIE